MDSCAQWHDSTTLPLAALRKGARGVVSAVQEDSAADGTITRRLREIGFVPGERIEIIGTVWPGGDPLAVRIGSSIFALRRREAQTVMVRVDSM
jgi:ferrous iron transport protein A